ncbi:MAG: nucleoside recognition domain-containing protein [Bacilli bacterium]|nr:nucleoside recognition domain-containing protein [Bacilli bacterium]
MINKLWSFLIVSGSLCLIFTNKVDVLNEQLLLSGKATLDIIIQIFPLLSLWLGIMNIAKVSGLLNKLSDFIYPLLHKLFPDIPKGHIAFSYISSNIIANLFGLGNAATPFGLKAMESLQSLNKDKEAASRSMITFLIINTCGLCLIPTTIISLRVLYKSISPSSIIFPCFIVSFLSLLFGLIIDKLFGSEK